METKENSNEPAVEQGTLEQNEETVKTNSAPEVSSAENTPEVVTDVDTKEDAVKALTNKEIIAYLAEKFPLCFSIKGAAKPLKIGIFQELAEQLADDDKVSKTRLRQVLRHYTSSWRYLKTVKLGAKRVDLQGEEVAEIDQEQADYAAKTLKESQEKFGHKNADKFANKKTAVKSSTKQGKFDKSASNKGKQHKKSTNQKHNSKFDNVKAKKVANNSTPIKLEKVADSSVKVGQNVKVQFGNAPMDAIVKEVVGNDVSVELSSGMIVKTQVSNLYMESTTTK